MRNFIIRKIKIKAFSIMILGNSIGSRRETPGVIIE